MPKTINYMFVACLALLLSGCATLKYANMEKPGVTLVSMQLAESTLLEQRFDIAVRLTNPNNFDLPITGLSYDMRLNGLKFGKGGSTGDMHIPALGEKLVQLKLSTSAFDWFKQFRKMQSGDGGITLNKMKYQVSGEVFLEGLAVKSLPFVREGEVGLGGQN